MEFRTKYYLGENVYFIYKGKITICTIQGIKIKEIPISYFPRSVDEGKKISWCDGITAITTLLKYRFRKKSHESK